MSAWGRAWGESWGLSWGLTYEAAQDDLGAVPNFFRRTKERRILVEIDGNRFLVPESDLHKWVSDKTEEVVEKIAQAPKRKLKVRRKKPPEIHVTVDDSWITALVARANRRIADEHRARIAYDRMMREIEDEETLLLLI